jgi:hypothetical protein
MEAHVEKLESKESNSFFLRLVAPGLSFEPIKGQEGIEGKRDKRLGDKGRGARDEETRDEEMRDEETRDEEMRGEETRNDEETRTRRQRVTREGGGTHLRWRASPGGRAESSSSGHLTLLVVLSIP